jgi:hypothetical protein
MATRLYLTNSAADFTPATLRGTYNDSTLSANVFALSTTKAGASTTAAVSESSTTNNYKALLHRFVSAPITGGTFTAADASYTITHTQARQESATGMNAFVYIVVYVTQGDTDTVRGTLIAPFVGATEFATSMTAFSYSLQFDNTVVAQAGDRIVIEIGYNATNTSATAFTGTVRYGGTAATDLATSGTTGVTTNSPWIEFSTALDAVLAPYTHSATAGGTTPVVRSGSSATGTSASSIAPAKPAGLTVGDLMFAVEAVDADGNLTAMTAPTGWTLIGSQAGDVANNFPFVKIWGKIADSSDTAASTFTFGAATGSAINLIAVQADTYDPADWTTTLAWTTQARIASQVITAPSTGNVLNGLLIAALCADTNGTTQSFPTPPTGMTEIGDASQTFALCGVFAEALATGTGSTGTRSATPTPSSTTNGWTAASFVINPGPAPAVFLPGPAVLNQAALVRASYW